MTGFSAPTCGQRRFGHGGSVTAQLQMHFCSMNNPVNDGASSQGKQGVMTVDNQWPCHVSALSNSASNEQ